jgi:hypothetical protein
MVVSARSERTVVPLANDPEVIWIERCEVRHAGGRISQPRTARGNKKGPRVRGPFELAVS